MILESKKIKCHCFHFFPIYLPWSDGTRCHDLSFLNVEFFFCCCCCFWMWSFKPGFHSPLSPSSRGSLVPLQFLPLECIIYISEVVIFPGNLDFSPALCMMYSAYKLNNQGDNIQPWCTPFPILNQSTVPCPVLTVASWPAHRFLRRQVRWSSIPISLRVFHNLLWST